MSCDVSVIIPTYNSSGTLRMALDSVYSQSLLPQEIIIVDDGSDDHENSKIIAESYPDNIRICFHRMEKNEGVSAARNTGIKASSCRYIAFLDSDDVWFKDKLKIQSDIMNRRKLDYSVHRYINDLNRESGEAGTSHDVSPPCSPLSAWSLLFQNCATPAVMVLREKMVPFDTSLRRCEDWKCWMGILSGQGSRGMYIRQSLAGGIKARLGATWGLSQDVKAMHDSKLLALKRLRSEGSITTAQYIVGICVELAKYPVRILRLKLS